ncbi:MAG TPA: ribbon-helix-helix domain-containing protein [Thermoplasmata archaeon]|nr:ribbon-helix-helix domain-containing protein [Thermoplasmata archaeon]
METVASKIPKALADGMDRLIASGRYANRSEILRVAVRTLLDSEGSTGATRTDPPIPPRVRAFYRRLRELAKDPRYRERWVALHGDDVVDVDGDHDALIRRILEREEEPIYVGLATDDPTPPRARVPSVVRARRA